MATNQHVAYVLGHSLEYNSFSCDIRYFLLCIGRCSGTAWWAAVDIWWWICQSYAISVLPLQRSLDAEFEGCHLAESDV